MPKAREWTKEQNATIIKMRKENKTWAEIGLALNVSRNTVIEHGRRINADKPTYAELQAMREAEQGFGISKNLNREPLPAGHPLFWQLLCPHDDYPHKI